MLNNLLCKNVFYLIIYCFFFLLGIDHTVYQLLFYISEIYYKTCGLYYSRCYFEHRTVQRFKYYYYYTIIESVSFYYSDTNFSPVICNRIHNLFSLPTLFGLSALLQADLHWGQLLSLFQCSRTKHPLCFNGSVPNWLISTTLPNL